MPNAAWYLGEKGYIVRNPKFRLTGSNLRDWPLRLGKSDQWQIWPISKGGQPRHKSGADSIPFAATAALGAGRSRDLAVLFISHVITVQQPNSCPGDEFWRFFDCRAPFAWPYFAFSSREITFLDNIVVFGKT